MSLHDLLVQHAHPVSVKGTLIEAKLGDVKLGEICNILRSSSDLSIVAKAQVIAFNGDITRLSLIGTSLGLTRDILVSPTGSLFTISVSESLKGTVILPDGSVSQRFGKAAVTSETVLTTVEKRPPRYDQRREINEMLHTDIRVVDSVVPCGIGQRMGIFASAGCGKTTLMHMLINNILSDVFIIALIGERGREVTEFVEDIKNSPHKDNCIVVYASSDFSALDRSNAALVAMTIAEYFRDQGENVVLFMDSITRYARALRDISLSAGQMPARRGYPATVFEQIPVLLERAGKFEKGSITAFFTVLTESEDEMDPITEEVKSILDGHIYLSNRLAEKNHYPAIDPLRSVSRVSMKIMEPEHIQLSGKLRILMSDIHDLESLIRFGEYKAGDNIKNDAIYNLIIPVREFLTQEHTDQTTFEETKNLMRGLLADN